jgi:hypothetical protein
MKLVSSVLVASIFIENSFCPYTVSAEVTFDATNSTLKGEIPCHKVGNLLLAEGLALLNADLITVEAKDSTTGHSTAVLEGHLFNVTATDAAANASYKGYAFFRDGSMLSRIETACNNERVDLKDGSHVVGPISDVTQQSLKVGAQTIATSSVASVHSPRVYQFKVNQAMNATSKISFSPTCTVAAQGFHLSKKRAILITLLVAGVATGIACGVAIPLSVHHHHAPPTLPTTKPITTTTVMAVPITSPKQVVFVPPRIINPLHFRPIPPGITGKPTHPLRPPPPPPPPPPPFTP